MDRLSRAAKDRRMTRNRLIVEACEVALTRRAAEWPPGLFDRKGTRELRATFPDWVGSIERARRTKGKAPF